MGSYKDLKVWRVNQESISLTLKVMRGFAGEYAAEHIGKQLFRSISSVGANLAEGHDSHEGREFIRYIGIAIRSAVESDYWLSTLENLYGRSADIEKLIALNVEVIKMLKGLRKSIEEKRAL